MELEKFGRYLSSPMGQTRVRASALHEREAVVCHLDLAWYASCHDLENADHAVEHFCTLGLAQLFAPNQALASEDGITLSQWGAEYLLRAGIPLGAWGQHHLELDDRRAQNPFGLRNTGKKKVAVVTAIFDGYDRLLPVDPEWTKDADFFLFSDQYISPHGSWQHLHANYYHDDPTRRARFVKLHLATYFSNYDWVIWIDGNILLCADPAAFLRTLDTDSLDFATFRHPDRSSLVAEAAACVRFQKEDPQTLAAHLQHIQTHPAFRGDLLFETMVVALRPGSRAVRSMCTAWWRIMMSGSRRDQLALPLAVAETPELRVGTIPDQISATPFFAKIKHSDPDKDQH